MMTMMKFVPDRSGDNIFSRIFITGNQHKNLLDTEKILT